MACLFAGRTRPENPAQNPCHNSLSSWEFCGQIHEARICPTSSLLETKKGQSTNTSPSSLVCESSPGHRNISNSHDFLHGSQQVLNPTPLNPAPATCHKRKRKLRCSFRECCAAETALQHWLFCSEEVIWTKSCAAANEKLHCNIAKAALQESGAFLPLSCGFQAPTFRHPRSDLLREGL